MDTTVGRQTSAAPPSAPVALAGPAANAAKTRRAPVRTCVACRTSGGKRGLLRVVRLGGGEDAGKVVLDPTGKKSGRGAYVCPTPECVGLALRQKKLERSLKTPVGEEVAAALRAAADAAAPAGPPPGGPPPAGPA